MARLLRHCQPKGAETARPNRQGRASPPPLHFVESRHIRRIDASIACGPDPPEG